jgi:hypothetical protein
MPSPVPPEPVTVLLRITRSVDWSLQRIPPRPVLAMMLFRTWLLLEYHATRMPQPHALPVPMLLMLLFAMVELVTL